uniref:PP-loop domain-containing protein n=1 Tax=uncultured organism TaxID=155900 RepID=M1QBR3_9ZZZZ|nr:PP-loop domain-containing protein [uncultured organism]
MKECSFCGRRAVYYQRTAGVYRCDRCFSKNIEKRFRRTVNKYDLLEPGDRVIAGVSGGSDSVVNLKLLADYSDYRDIEVVSLTIDEGIEGYRDESVPIVKENSKKLGVDHYFVRFKDVFGKSLDELADISSEVDGPDPCTLCGILRRSLLNQASRELGGDKLAIGHNLDDEVQTIMLNYIRGDISRLKRLGPKTEAQEGFVQRIKPLREIMEKEIAIYGMLKDLSIHIATCSYVGGMRSEVRDFINKLEDNHPTTKFRILRMFEELKPNLPSESEDFELKRCEICDEPATGALCRACELLNNLGIEREKKALFPTKDKR